jgi:hypothetical protein
MRSLNFLNLPNPSSLPALEFIQPLTEIRTRKKSFWGVECGRKVRLTLLPSVSRLSKQCGILNISQPYRLPQPATGPVLFHVSSIGVHWNNCHKQRRFDFIRGYDFLGTLVASHVTSVLLPLLIVIYLFHGVRTPRLCSLHLDKRKWQN